MFYIRNLAEVCNHNKINAIRIYRNLVRCSLKEAKDVIDANWERDLKIPAAMSYDIKMILEENNLMGHVHCPYDLPKELFEV